MSKNFVIILSLQFTSSIKRILLSPFRLPWRVKLKNSFYYVILFSTIIFFYSCTDPYSQGQRIYTTLCSNCHGDDGNGLKKLIPSIVDSKILSDPQKLICTIRNGINADSLDTKLSVMPSHKKMSDVEMTNLVNYINQAFSEHPTYFKLDDVEIEMKKCN